MPGNGISALTDLIFYNIILISIKNFKWCHSLVLSRFGNQSSQGQNQPGNNPRVPMIKYNFKKGPINRYRREFKNV